MGQRAGHVTGHRIGKVKGMPIDMRILQVAFTDENFPETVLMFSESGEDTCPAVGDMVYVIPVGSESSKISLVTHDKITPTAAEGEKRIYSQAAGVVKASIHLKADGSITIDAPGDVTINGNVQVNGTINATSNIKSDTDVIADTISLKSHLHPENNGGTTSAPTMTPSAPSVPFATHVHSQGNDSDGDIEADTGVPHT